MNVQRAPGTPDDLAEPPPRVPREIAAEASVWVARLHGPDRSPQMERECLAWQARSPAHRLAFERCTDTWQDVARLTLTDYAHAGAQAAPSARQGWRVPSVRWAVGLAIVAFVPAIVLGINEWREIGAYSTGLGEQQLVVLDDGTRMSLNTATQVQVDLTSAQRTVNIEAGEALFEVAKDAKRPFVVRVAGSEVVARGTVFAVRFVANSPKAGDTLAVTLIEGAVTVRPAADGGSDGVAPLQAVSMQPGERVKLARGAGNAARVSMPQVDRPSIEQLVAWKRSEAVFDNASLADAVAEMNRYSRTPIVLVGGSSLADLRVSGLYHVGDNAGFVRAVAALHGLKVREPGGRLELMKPQ